MGEFFAETIIITTRQTGGLLAPKRGNYRPAPKDAGFHFCSSLLPLPLLPPLKGRLYYLPPLKGSSYSRTLNLSSAISCFSCSSIYFRIVASFSPTVLT